MQKLWRPCPSIRLEPVDVNSLPTETRDHLLSYSIDLVSLGFEHRGDFLLHRDDDVESVRFFQSADGAVLARISESSGKRSFDFGSILADGTYVRSIPHAPAAPWNCCRFPVHVLFGDGCGIEDLLVMHLQALAELEHGCGITSRYEASRLEEVVIYLHELVHETVYAQGAPDELLAVPQPTDTRTLFAN